MRFTFGQNPEWYASTTKNVGVLLTLGKSYAGGCNIKLVSIFTPTAQAPTAYSLPLSSFSFNKDCGSGLTVAQALAQQPVSQIDFQGEPGTSTTQSVTLYNTNTSPTTVTGTFRNMGPQSNIDPTVTEPVSAPPLGSPVPPQGATAAAPIQFNVPAGLDRLEVKEITPDPTNNTMLEIALFNPSGAYVQSSYDDGSTSQNVTSLSAAANSGPDQRIVVRVVVSHLLLTGPEATFARPPIEYDRGPIAEDRRSDGAKKAP